MKKRTQTEYLADLDQYTEDSLKMLTTEGKAQVALRYILLTLMDIRNNQNKSKRKK